MQLSNQSTHRGLVARSTDGARAGWDDDDAAAAAATARVAASHRLHHHQQQQQHAPHHCWRPPAPAAGVAGGAGGGSAGGGRGGPLFIPDDRGLGTLDGRWCWIEGGHRSIDRSMHGRVDGLIGAWCIMSMGCGLPKGALESTRIDRPTTLHAAPQSLHSNGVGLGSIDRSIRPYPHSTRTHLGLRSTDPTTHITRR